MKEVREEDSTIPKDERTEEGDITCDERKMPSLSDAFSLPPPSGGKKKSSETDVSMMNMCIRCNKRGCDLGCYKDDLGDVPVFDENMDESIPMFTRKDANAKWVPIRKHDSFWKDKKDPKKPPTEEELHEKRVEEKWIEFYKLEHETKHQGNMFGLLYSLATASQLIWQSANEHGIDVCDIEFDLGEQALRMFKSQAEKGNFQHAVLIKCAALKPFSVTTGWAPGNPWPLRRVMDDYTHRFALISKRPSPVPESRRRVYPSL